MAVVKSAVEFSGRKVLMLGIGILGGGIGMAQYCARHGATLRITDLRSPEHLQVAFSALSDIDPEYILGRHREEDIDWADIVIRNPGVPPDHPLLERARAQGKPVDMEMAFFIRNCPARLIAVTGTKGKTTTTTVLYEFLRTANPAIGLAGNMGTSAIDLLDGLSPADEVLLEVSSYQLEGLVADPGRISIALITNVDDDHLDRYGSLEAYRRVKASIGKAQASDDWLILPAWDGELMELCRPYPSRKAFVRAGPADPAGAGSAADGVQVTVADGKVHWHEPGEPARCIADLRGLRLLGSHNQLNVAFAAAAAHAAGRWPADVTSAVGSLQPVPHRLEPVASAGRVNFINDSAASAPLAVVAALEALAGRKAVVIAGGDDKSADTEPMLAALDKVQAPVVILPGTMQQHLMSALARRPYQYPVVEAASMSDAVRRAYDLAKADPAIEVVLLSPGFSSHSAFINEFDRGAQFREAAARISLEVP